MGFNHRKIEAKWQAYWQNQKTFKTENAQSKRNTMWTCFLIRAVPASISDTRSHRNRYRSPLQTDENFASSDGLDAFGLPAEQYALSTGHDPRDSHNTRPLKAYVQSII